MVTFKIDLKIGFDFAQKWRRDDPWIQGGNGKGVTVGVCRVFGLVIHLGREGSSKLRTQLGLFTLFVHMGAVVRHVLVIAPICTKLRLSH